MGLLLGDSVGDLLDDLIDEGSKNLRRSSPFNSGVYVKPESPYEATTRFVGYAAWFDLIQCACGKSSTRFDGIFEERARLDNTKSWLRCSVVPGAVTVKVSYIRKHRIVYCEHCSGALTWPVTSEHLVPPIEEYRWCLVPSR